MAPHWAKMADELAAELAPQGVYFGEINCLKNYSKERSLIEIYNTILLLLKMLFLYFLDLCEQNKIEGYPTIQLWNKGVYIEEYRENYLYEPMKNYAQTLSKRFQVPEAPKVEDGTPAYQPSSSSPTVAANASPTPESTPKVEEKVEEEKSQPQRIFNIKGKVIDLVDDNFDDMVKKRPLVR